MKKKIYLKPDMTVMEMKQQQVICTSAQLYLYDNETTTEQW